MSGGGHLHRSINLASEFYIRGCNVTIMTTNGINHYVNKNLLHKFQSEEAFVKSKYDLLVLDNYKLDNEDFRFFRQYAYKTLVLDDLCNRKIDCDFIWDPTITHDSIGYESLVPDSCKLFIGGEYQIYSDDHIDFALKLNRKKINDYNHIHFYNGYTNTFPLTDIEQFFKDNGVPTTYLGGQLKNIQNNGINLVKDFSLNPIESYAASKLGVGSPGNMLWERGSIGLPSYVLINNCNQIEICEQLMDANLLVLGSTDWCENQLAEAKSIDVFFNDRNKLETISKNLLNKINLMGKRILVSRILEEYDISEKS